MPGVTAGMPMTGRSLKPLVRGNTLKSPWRVGLLLENMYTGRDTPLHEGDVNDRWKYNRSSKKPYPFTQTDIDDYSVDPALEMLFSLTDDPAEINNLAANPAYSEKLAELKTKCDGELSRLLKLRADYSVRYQLDE